MNPNQVYYSSNSPRPNRGRKMLLIIGIILLVILIAAAIAVALTGKDKSNNGANSGDSNNSSNEGASSSATTLALSTQKNVTFIAPTNMEGYVRGTDFEESIGDYTLEDNSCNLQFGVVDSEELPGYSVEEAANYQLGLSAGDVTVNEPPKKISDLKLKDEKKDITYTMQTIETAFTRNNTNYISDYSFVILPGNNRAYLRTYCAKGSGDVSSSDLKAVNEKAKQVKIRTESQ